MQRPRLQALKKYDSIKMPSFEAQHFRHQLRETNEKSKKLRREGGWPLKATTNSKCERKCPLKWPLKHCLTKLPNAASIATSTALVKKETFQEFVGLFFCCCCFSYNLLLSLLFYQDKCPFFSNPTLFICKKTTHLLYKQ